MGILSSLGNILKVAGPIAAIPFTGGASAGLLGMSAGTTAAALGGLGAVGSVLGTQQAGTAGGKVQQADLNQRQDQNALASYIAQQNAQNTAANTDLQRKSFESSNRSTTAKQALIGALLGHGITPTSMSGGKASGGLLASFNGNPDAMAAMKMLASQAGSAQNTPLQFQGGQMLQAPKMTPLQQVDDGGAQSSIAKVLQVLGAASPYIKPKAPPMTDDQYGGGMPGGQY